MARQYFVKAVCVVLCLFSAAADAADYTAKITYISTAGIYLDAGRDQGVAVGDSCFVARDTREVAALLVTFVSDKSSSAQLIDSSVHLFAGENVVIRTRMDTEGEQLATGGEAIKEEEDSTRTGASRARRDAARVSGRFGFEVLSQNTKSEFGYDYFEPSAVLKVQAMNVGGRHHAVSVYARWRNLYRGSSGQLEQKSSRVYEASLTYDDPLSKWNYGAGRLLIRDLRGIGYIDGAVVRYRASQRTSVGVFGGTEPDRETSEIRSEVAKSGGFASFDSKRKELGRVQGVLALAGSYESGEIDREFVYQQITYSHGAKFSLYESAELNLNRGWKKDAEGSSFDVTGLLMNARWSVTEKLAVALAYDTRRSYYAYNTRTVPDSLFDDAVRQGFRAQLSAQISDVLSGQIGASLRTESGSTSDATAEWIQVNWAKARQGSARITADFRRFESAFSKGIQPSLTLSKSFARRHHASLAGGVNNYKLAASKTEVKSSWVRLAAETELAKGFYLRGEAEANRGTDWDSDVFVVGAGYKF